MTGKRTTKKKAAFSGVITFRIPDDLLSDLVNAVSDSGQNRTAWLVDAIRMKLSRPGADSRLLSAVERLENAVGALTFSDRECKEKHDE